MIFSNWFSSKPIVPTEAEKADLKKACVDIARHLKNAGYDTEAFSSDLRPLPKDFSRRLEVLKIFAEVLEDHQKSPVPSNHKELMWKFFARMRYCPTADILDRIEDDDCIEVYDNAGVQIFRNLKYFGVVSFSVEDLVSMSWKREYKRKRKIMLSLLDLSFRFATGRFHDTYDCSKIPIHEVQEMIAKRYLIELNLKWISPLKQNGKCVGLIAISRARRLSPAVT